MSSAAWGGSLTEDDDKGDFSSGIGATPTRPPLGPLCNNDDRNGILIYATASPIAAIDTKDNMKARIATCQGCHPEEDESLVF